jgi:hypothetical protein
MGSFKTGWCKAGFAAINFSPVKTAAEPINELCKNFLRVDI